TWIASLTPSGRDARGQRPGACDQQARRRGARWFDPRGEPATRTALHLHAALGARRRDAMSGRVLVVDDEVEMQRALRAGLRYHDFDVRAVGSGKEALREASSWRPDVILLDLGLPGMDGFETLAALRPSTRAGVIVVSVMPGEKDKVRALDLGADDYVVKPFGTEELVARIKAVLRRQADVTSGEPVIRIGDLEVDIARRVVSVAGRSVRLTPTEYEVLR